MVKIALALGIGSIVLALAWVFSMVIGTQGYMPYETSEQAHQAGHLGVYLLGLWTMLTLSAISIYTLAGAQTCITIEGGKSTKEGIFWLLLSGLMLSAILTSGANQALLSLVVIVVATSTLPLIWEAQFARFFHRGIRSLLPLLGLTIVYCGAVGLATIA